MYYCVNIRGLPSLLKLMDSVVLSHCLNRIKQTLLVLTVLWMGNMLWYDNTIVYHTVGKFEGEKV